MKQLLIFVHLIFFQAKFYSQAYTWATIDNTYYGSVGIAMATDNSNNLLAAETCSYYSSVGNGVNIIKYDSGHNILWTQKIEVKFYDELDITADVLGNVLVTGTYRDQLKVNNVTHSTTCTGCFSMFLIKFNAQGVLQWYKQTTGSDASGFKISTDQQNSIYVAGSVSGSTYFDAMNVTSPAGAHYDYVAKFDVNGNMLWLKQVKGGLAGGSYGFKTDAFGNSFLASGLYTSAQFDNLNLTSYGNQDIYLAKIDANGNWIWARHAGGNGQDEVNGLDLDLNGNPYITGFIDGTANFGGVLLNSSDPDYFIAKYDSAGNVVCAVSGGGAGNQVATNICVDGQGFVYIARTGTFFSKFDNNGVYLESQVKTVWNVAMTKNNGGCIYISGSMGNTVTFDSYTLSSTTPVQMYIAEYCDSGVADVREEENNGNFSFYPNPSIGKITLNSKGANDRCQLVIKNSLGQTMYNEDIDPESGSFIRQIDLSAFSKGVYFVELNRVSDHYSQKQKTREVKKVILQ